MQGQGQGQGLTFQGQGQGLTSLQGSVATIAGEVEICRVCMENILKNQLVKEF